MGTTAGQLPNPTKPDTVRAVTDPAAKTQQGGGSGGSGDGGTVKPGDAGTQGGDQFNREDLDPALRGMGPKQINELFMGLLQQAGRNGGREEPARPAEPAKPPEPINYKELMDPGHESYNPEKAFRGFVEQNYGTLLGDINKRSVQGLYGRFGGQIHDFKEYESEIEKALENRDPTSVSEKDILGTYLTLKGAKQLHKERQEMARTAGSTTHKPSTASEAVPDEMVLTPEQKEVAHMMFSKEPDPEGKYKEWKKKSDKGAYQLSVVTDATGKRE